MTDRVPDEVVKWARTTEPNSTMVDETGQKWWRGQMYQNAPLDPGSMGEKLVHAAKAAVDSVVWDRIELKRVYD